MPIDTDFTYISGLEKANPLAGDARSEGDDHIRGIKTAVTGSFPNIGAAAVTSTAAELSYTDVTTLGTSQNSKAMTVDSGGAVDHSGKSWTDLGTVTTADINGGTIDGVALGTTNTGNTETTGDDSTKLSTTAFVQQEITAKDRFAYHQITSSSDTTIPTSSATPTTIGSASISIPTKGRITIFPEQVRIITTTNTSKPVLGLQIGSTEYYVKWVDNGITKLGPIFAVVSPGHTDDFYGTWGDDDRTVESASFSIETLGILTGSRTVNLVVYDSTGSTGSTVAGSALRTKVTLIVEDFT